MRSAHFLILIDAVIIWLLDEVFLRWPQLFLICLTLGVLLLFFSIKFLAARTKVGVWLSFTSAPILFFLAFALYTAVLTSLFWIQVIFILSAWFIFTYLKNLYHYWLQATPDREKNLDNLMLGGAFLTLFAGGSSLFDLPAFLNWPLAALLLFFFLLAALLAGQFLPLKKVKWAATNWLFLIILAVFLELVWVLSFLPFTFNILGALAAISYYLLLLIMRLYWRGALNRDALKWPLIVGALLIILFLLTARWL